MFFMIVGRKETFSNSSLEIVRFKEPDTCGDELTKNVDNVFERTFKD